MKSSPSLAPTLVGAWLILYALLTAPFLQLSFKYSYDILAVLGLVAGVALILRR